MKSSIIILWIVITSMHISASEVIVNQVGYIPSLPKYVYCTAITDSFFVIEQSSGIIFYRGVFLLSAGNDPATGLTLYRGDFSELTREGIYFIKTSSEDSSYSFSISTDTFEEVFNKSLKSFYFQRCGTSLLSPHAGVYNRALCHSGDGFFHSSTGQSGYHPSTGGWHDAGDYGKYVVNAGITVGTLLMAFELFPEKFSSDNLNIPESGNDISDLLDEARYEINWLLKMQNQNGGIYFKLTPEQFEGFVMPSQATAMRFIYQLSTTATGDFAAMLARASRLYKQYDSTFSNQCLAAAENAWLFLSNQPTILPPGGFQNPAGTVTGQYGDGNDSDERLWAAAELFETTGESEYKDYFDFNFNLNEVFNSTMSWPNVSSLAQITYLFSLQPNADISVKDELHSGLLDYCNNLLNRNISNGFGVAINPGEYYWGSNSDVLNKAILLILGYERTQNENYRNAALDQLNYIYGINAHNFSFVTGTGTASVMNPHHRPSAADGIMEPIPGLLAGGPNQYLNDPVLQQHFNSSTPPALCYIDDLGSYASNEVAINWNAPLVFVTGYFNSYGTTSVENETGQLVPENFLLYQNYPNPFNPVTTIRFTIPSVGTDYNSSIKTDGVFIQLKVYDVLGKEVATLVNEYRPAGNYEIEFSSNDSLASGIYCYQLSVGALVETRKMILIR